MVSVWDRLASKILLNYLIRDWTFLFESYDYLNVPNHGYTTQRLESVHLSVRTSQYCIAVIFCVFFMGFDLCVIVIFSSIVLPLPIFCDGLNFS